MKVTLITGASGGIGKAFAERLASENHNLVLIARSEEKLKALCGQLSTKHKISVSLHRCRSDAIRQRSADRR